MQIRAAEAQEQRDTATAAEAQTREETEAHTSRETDRIALARMVLAWAGQVQAVDCAVSAADAALAASEGEVTGDAAWQALAALAEQVRAAVEAPPDDPTGADMASLAVIVADLAAATIVVTGTQDA